MTTIYFILTKVVIHFYSPLTSWAGTSRRTWRARSAACEGRGRQEWSALGWTGHPDTGWKVADPSSRNSEKKCSESLAFVI